MGSILPLQQTWLNVVNYRALRKVQALVYAFKMPKSLQDKGGVRGTIGYSHQQLYGLQLVPKNDIIPESNLINYQIQIHVLGLPATTTGSCLRCCSKGAVFCRYSYQFWFLLSRYRTFMGTQALGGLEVPRRKSSSLGRGADAAAGPKNPASEELRRTA